MKLKPLPIAAAIVGIVLVIVGFIYATQPAGSLPGFFPGHAAGSTAKHMKHAIAAFVVAICCFLFVWFQSGSKSTAAK